MASTMFGKYRLIAELGHGGMADVFLAVQAGPAGSGFRKLTVVKRLRQNLADEPEFVAMLVDEARIAARLNHPNVVQTNEVGHVANQYFIAMEYLDGQPLHRIQHRCTKRATEGGATLAPEHYYLILMETLAGLHHAHELADYDGTPLQIVHRDVTPHNIFVTYAGQVKVVDFGIAKAAGRASETRQGVVKGKVRYMAPEQALGQAIDRRADIFAAGVMLWEAATKRRLWKNLDELQIVQALINGKLPPSPQEVEPSVPDAVDRICKRALQPNPADRYETAEDFRADLEQHLVESGKLVEARRQLAPFLIDLFRDKRAEIKSVIESQLAAVDDGKSGDFLAVPLQIDSTHSNPTGVSMSVEEKGAASPSLAAPKAPPRRPWAPYAVGAGALGLLAVAGLAMRTGKAQPTTATTEPASATAPAAAERVAVRVTGRPTGITVRIDDGPKRELPLDIRVPKDTAEHTLSFEAEGHVPRLERHIFDRDVTIAIELEKKSDKVKPTSPATVGAVMGTVAVRPAIAAAPGKPDRVEPPKTPEKPPEPATSAAPHPSAADTARRPNGGALTIDNNDPWGQKK